MTAPQGDRESRQSRCRDQTRIANYSRRSVKPCQSWSNQKREFTGRIPLSRVIRYPLSSILIGVQGITGYYRLLQAITAKISWGVVPPPDLFQGAVFHLTCRWPPRQTEFNQELAWKKSFTTCGKIRAASLRTSAITRASRASRPSPNIVRTSKPARIGWRAIVAKSVLTRKFVQPRATPSSSPKLRAPKVRCVRIMSFTDITMSSLPSHFNFGKRRPLSRALKAARSSRAAPAITSARTSPTLPPWRLISKPALPCPAT